MKRRIVVFLVFILAVGLCAGLIWFNFFKDKMIKDFFANMKAPAQVISSAKVEARTWTPAVSAIGTARAANGVELSFETPGIVKEIKFKANQEVRMGEVLVQLDDAVERADLQDVRAAVKVGESSFERAKTLSSRGYGTEANFDQASAALAAARSRLARIEATIEQKALKAPFSGIIGIPRIDIGQYLQPGTVIASFQDLSSMKVDFTVPEQDASKIKLGQDVRVGVAPNDLRFTGRVTGKDPRVDPKTRLVSVQAAVEAGKDGDILPGQFLHVEAILPPEPNVITIPQTAVITSLYGDYVYTIEPEDKGGQKVDVAKQVFVKTGRRRGSAVEILSGVEPGQQIVASGQNKLQAGSTVKINNTIDLTKIDMSKLATE